jgi:hypothetical protein
VDDLVVVEVLHGGEHLTDDLDGEATVQGSLGEQVLEGVRAPLEREVEEALCFEGIVHVDNARMPQQQEALALADPLRLHLGVGALGGHEHLDREALIERSPRLVDRTVLASADDTTEGVRAPLGGESLSFDGKADQGRRPWRDARSGAGARRGIRLGVRGGVRRGAGADARGVGVARGARPGGCHVAG